MFSIFHASRTRLSLSTLCTPLTIGVALFNFCPMAGAQTLSAPFSANYSIGFNGFISNVPTPDGGFLFKQNDPNTLLIMGSSANNGGKLYSAPVTRGSGGHITGFGAAVFVSTAINNDGGLVYAPNGTLLFTRYPNNDIGEIKPGSSSPDKIVALPGVTPNGGTLQYVPAGFSNAGQLKIVSYNGGNWYNAVLTPDGTGTYDIGTSVTGVTTGGGPEGVVYVRSGNPNFAVDSILVSEYQAHKVSAYTADANGNPVVSSRQDFITGFFGTVGGTVDPTTGDFVFSTFDGNSSKVVVVQGFNSQAVATPEPGGIALLAGMGLSGSVFAFRRRRTRK